MARVAAMNRKPAKKKPKRRYRTKPQPVCEVHGILMNCRSTTISVRYFYCPIEDCCESAKQERDDRLI